jgi:hypothetical protein
MGLNDAVVSRIIAIVVVAIVTISAGVGIYIGWCIWG